MRIKNNNVIKLITERSYVKRLSIGKAIGLILVAELLHALMSAIFIVFTEGIAGNLSEVQYMWFEFITTGIILRFIATMIVINMYTQHHNEEFKGKKLKINYKDYILAIVIMISYILITYGIIDEILFSLPMLIPDELVNIMIEEYEKMTPAINFVSTVLCAAFFEEIVFRGLVLKGLLNRYSPKKAIIYSAIAFGVIHLNLPQGLNAFVIGLVFGIIYYYTRSLPLCMAMHATNNFLVDFIIVPDNFMVKIALYIIIPIVGVLLFRFCSMKLNLRQRAIDEDIIL